jgi:hypothetical protein
MMDSEWRVKHEECINTTNKDVVVFMMITLQLFVTAGRGKGAQAQMAGTFASIVFSPTPPGHDQDDDGHTK